VLSVPAASAVLDDSLDSSTGCMEARTQGGDRTRRLVVFHSVDVLENRVAGGMMPNVSVNAKGAVIVDIAHG